MSVSDSLARRASSESHHLRAACRRGAGRDGLLDQAERARADGVAHLEVGEAPVLLQPARRSCGGSGSVARSRSTHSLSGAIGTRSGSGK